MIKVVLDSSEKRRITTKPITIYFVKLRPSNGLLFGFMFIVAMC